MTTRVTLLIIVTGFRYNKYILPLRPGHITLQWPTNVRRSLRQFFRGVTQQVAWRKHMFLTSKSGRMQDRKVVEENHAIYFSLVCIESPLLYSSNIHISVEANNGSGFIHKSKLNTNGTFSVGKTWRLPELRAIQVVNVREL